MWFLFQAVAFGAIAHTASEHDDLVVSVFLLTLLMLESEDGAADEGLTELVTEIRGTIRGLGQNLLWCLVQPLAHGKDVLPIAGSTIIVMEARIGCHINCCTRNRPRADAPTHTVADFTACACCGTIKRLNRCGEVMRLSLQ